MDEPTDFLGNKIELGKEVVHLEKGRTCFYRGSYIIGITPCMVRLVWSTYELEKWEKGEKLEEWQIFRRNHENIIVL